MITIILIFIIIITTITIIVAGAPTLTIISFDNYY